MVRTPRGRRRTLAGLLAGLAMAGSLAPLAPAARADGDPASDVLVGTPVFLAADSGASAQQKLELVAQLRRADRHGRPLRVAVIASRSDLGSIAAYWRDPRAYAQFLGRELSLVFHGELLVVMPDGFGVERGGRAVRTSLAGLAPRSGELATASAQAIDRLTGVAAVSAAAPSAIEDRSPTAGPGWWLPAGVGSLIVLGLWGVSLYRAPVRGRRRGPVERGHA